MTTWTKKVFEGTFTFQEGDSRRKADVVVGFLQSKAAQSPASPFADLAEGFSYTRDLLEECQYQSEKVLQKFQDRLLQLFSTASTSFIQGAFAALYFFNETVSGALDQMGQMLTECLYRANVAVQQAIQHLHLLGREQQQRRVAAQ